MVQIQYDKIKVILVIILFIVTGSVIIFMLPPDDSSLDSDGDGVMNDIDTFPHDKSENKDSDGDGIGDNQDMFPADPAASLDSDADGYPDAWNEGKDQSDSTSEPILIIDEVPFDPNEHSDSDGDGYGDNSDMFPTDPNEWSDDDGDGIGGNTDKNPLVDLSFNLSIEKFLFSKHVDILPRAQIYFIINYDGSAITWDNDGNYWKMWKNQETTIEKTLSFDIDDSTESAYTEIEIIMMDHDVLFGDDIIDISDQAGRSSLLLILDHTSNTITAENGLSEGENGKIWFNVELGSAVSPIKNLITKTYNWRYLGNQYTISIDISNEKYQWYKNREVNRTPQSIGSFAMASFVTTHDLVISQLADQLQSLALDQGFNTIESGNFILRFVQYAVDYSDDNDTKGCVEYWRYPVETLMEETGDCEDSTLLYASLMDNLGYDTVLLFYIINEDVGHLATGVHIDEIIDGVTIEYEDQLYYYCETTSAGFNIGEKPSEIITEPEEIIPI